MKFRKKPVLVNAEQFTGNVLHHVGVFCDDNGQPYVVTIHNQASYIVPGDWIIPEPDGIHYYPCKDDIFKATYEYIPDEVPSDLLKKAEEQCYKDVSRIQKEHQQTLEEECECWEGCNDREGRTPCKHSRLPEGAGPFNNTSTPGKCRCGAEGPPWHHAKNCQYD